MKCKSGERQSADAKVRSFAALGALSLALSSCESQNSNEAIQGREFSVTDFTYDRATDLGHIAASEKFQSPVTNEQAEGSMEDILHYSGYEFRLYWPNIPSRVRRGSFVCHVISHDDSQKEFNLNCDVVPAPDPTVPA